jgi:flagellar biosynthesis/type III secretory pathway chaperone
MKLHTAVFGLAALAAGAFAFLAWEEARNNRNAISLLSDRMKGLEMALPPNIATELNNIATATSALATRTEVRVRDFQDIIANKDAIIAQLQDAAQKAAAEDLTEDAAFQETIANLNGQVEADKADSARQVAEIAGELGNVTARLNAINPVEVATPPVPEGQPVTPPEPPTGGGVGLPEAEPGPSGGASPSEPGPTPEPEPVPTGTAPEGTAPTTPATPTEPAPTGEPVTPPLPTTQEPNQTNTGEPVGGNAGNVSAESVATDGGGAAGSAAEESVTRTRRGANR